MNTRFACAGLTALLLSACASMPTPVALQERPGQPLTYVRGTPCAESLVELPEGPVLASLCAEPASTRRANLTLRIANRSLRPVTLREGALVATASGQSLKVLGHRELMKEEKTKQAWAALATGLAAASNNMAAADAGYTNYSGYGTTRATAYGSGGYATATGTTTYYGTAYNGAAAAAARDRADAKNAQLFDQLAARNQMAEAAISDALRTHTIQPGEAHGTYVGLDLPRRSGGSKAEVDVTVMIEGVPASFGVVVGP